MLVMHASCGFWQQRFFGKREAKDDINVPKDKLTTKQ